MNVSVALLHRKTTNCSLQGCMVRDNPIYLCMTYELTNALSDVTARFPKIGQLLQKTILDAKLDTIKLQKYKKLKQCLITIDALLTELEGLHHVNRSEVIQLVLDGNLEGVERILDGHQSKHKSQGWSLSISNPFSKDTSPGQKLVQKALGVAADTPDVNFISRLTEISARDTLLQTPVVDTENAVRNHFDTTIPKLLEKLVHTAFHIQLEECGKQIKREASSDAERDIARLRNDFMRQIERSSQSESNSYAYPI